MNEVEVPLIQQLKEIPQSARIVIEEQYSSQNIPIGKLCHDAAERIEELEKYLRVLEEIANDYSEESHDKIKQQRNDHIRWAKEALNNCNGFCGEYECKENKYGCKRENIKKDLKFTTAGEYMKDVENK